MVGPRLCNKYRREIKGCRGPNNKREFENGNWKKRQPLLCMEVVYSLPFSLRKQTKGKRKLCSISCRHNLLLLFFTERLLNLR
jgi:hypothetical protein